MKEVNIDPALIKHRDEQAEKSREKIKEYFMTGQIDPEVAMFSLRLLGLTIAKAKELIKKWTSDKNRR